MKTIHVLSALLMLSLPAFAVPIQSEPPETVALVEIHGLAKLVNEAYPVCGALKNNMDPSKLASSVSGMFVSPNMAGIDTNGLVRLYILGQGANPAQTGRPEAAAIIPLSAMSSDYLKNVASQYEIAGKAGSATHFSGPKSAGLEPDFYVEVSGKHAVVGADMLAVKRIASIMSKGGLKAESTIPVQGTVRIKLFPAGCMSMLEQSRQQATAGAAMSGNVNVTAALESQFKLYRKALAQVQAMYFGVSMAKNDMTIETRIVPLAGSTLAGTVAALKPPSDKLAAIIPPGSPLVVCGSGLNAFDRMSGSLAEFISDSAKASGQDITTAKKMLADMKGLMSGDFALGVLANPDGKGLAVVQCVAVTDMDQALKYRRTAMAEAEKAKDGTFARIVQDAPRTHNGIEVIPFHYSIDNAQSSRMGAPPAVASLLGKIKGEIAIANGMMIQTIGGPEAMNAVLDSFKHPGIRADKSNPFIDVFPQVKRTPVYFETIDLPRLVKVFITACSGANTQGLPDMPDGTGGLALYAAQDGADLIVTTRITTRELTACKASFSRALPFLLFMSMGGMR